MWNVKNQLTKCHHATKKQAAPEDKEANIQSIDEDNNQIWCKHTETRHEQLL